MKREVAMADQRGSGRLLRVLIATVAVVLAATAVTVPQEPLKASATIKEVMATMTGPSSEVIFAAASEPPKDDLQWVAVRNSAVTLAESGELLMTGGRNRDTTTWMAMSRGMVTQAQAAQAAAEARNSDELSQAGDDVYETCKACHASYMNP
jgi:cytochrome c556